MNVCGFVKLSVTEIKIDIEVEITWKHLLLVDYNKL